jgi:uncharacterized protein YjiS (DUF1127 family)
MEHSLTASSVRTATGWFKRIGIAAALYRQRKALSRLQDHLLDDIGIDRARADIEASRPVWDVPRTWMR